VRFDNLTIRALPVLAAAINKSFSRNSADDGGKGDRIRTHLDHLELDLPDLCICAVHVQLARRTRNSCLAAPSLNSYAKDSSRMTVQSGEVIFGLCSR
jgi:hypothetical protein